MAGWREGDAGSTMSDGWVPVNGGSADECRCGAATGDLPNAVGKGLWIEFTLSEGEPAPVDAFVPAGRRGSTGRA
jgi:hypothetical protein